MHGSHTCFCLLGVDQKHPIGNKSGVTCSTHVTNYVVWLGVSCLCGGMCFYGHHFMHGYNIIFVYVVGMAPVFSEQLKNDESSLRQSNSN